MQIKHWTIHLYNTVELSAMNLEVVHLCDSSLAWIELENSYDYNPGPWCFAPIWPFCARRSCGLHYIWPPQPKIVELEAKWHFKAPWWTHLQLHSQLLKAHPEKNSSCPNTAITFFKPSLYYKYKQYRNLTTVKTTVNLFFCFYSFLRFSKLGHLISVFSSNCYFQLCWNKGGRFNATEATLCIAAGVQLHRFRLSSAPNAKFPITATGGQMSIICKATRQNLKHSEKLANTRWKDMIDWQHTGKVGNHNAQCKKTNWI